MTGLYRQLFNASEETIGLQYEIEEQTKISFNFHCVKCGKFKNKNTNSKYCFKCLGLK